MELSYRKAITNIAIYMSRSKVAIVIYTLQFAASINLITTLIFEEISIYIKTGLIICSMFFVISSWFLIIFDNKITFIERVSNQKNDDHSKYKTRINGKVDELAYPLFLGFLYTIYSLIIIIILILKA